MVRASGTRATLEPGATPSAFAIKAPFATLGAPAYAFQAQKTMYRGKTIAVGSVLYLFESENEGGRGLFAKGRVTSVEGVARRPEPVRQTPRVDVAAEVLAVARIRFGRVDLRPFSDWSDGRPETEIAFKLYRQATDKVVGLTEVASHFLDELFRSPRIGPEQIPIG